MMNKLMAALVAGAFAMVPMTAVQAQAPAPRQGAGLQGGGNEGGGVQEGRLDDGGMQGRGYDHGNGRLQEGRRGCCAGEEGKEGRLLS